MSATNDFPRGSTHRGGAILRTAAVLLLTLCVTAREPIARCAGTEVDRILDEVAVLAPDADASLATRVTRLGVDAVPALLDRLERRAELHLVSASAVDEPTGRRVHAIVLDALRGTPRSVVRAELSKRMAASPSIARRGGAVLCIAAIGSPDDVPELLAVAEPELDPDGLELPFERIAIEAVLAIANTHADTWRSASALIQGLSLPASQVVLRAAAKDAGTEALEFLAQALDQLLQRRSDVLSVLQSASSRAVLPVPERLRRRTRELLESSDDHVAAQAALLTGHFEDSEAAETLVQGLEHSAASVRRNAHWALQRISGLGLRDDPRRWRAWLDDEMRWWDARFERARRGLQSEDTGTVRASILDMGRRRLGRDRLAHELIPLLGHPDSATAQIAARAVGALASRASMAELELARESADSLVLPAIDAALANLRAASKQPRTRLGL